MKRLALAVLLALAPALAPTAPPTAAQIDALMAAMDARAGVAATRVQMEATSRRMVESMLAPDADAASRAAMERGLAAPNAAMRELMDWNRLEPAYRIAYAEVFTADEVEAMTRFHSTAEGRAVLHKMPLLMGRLGEAMPAMRESMKRLDEVLRDPANPKAASEPR